MSSPWLANSDPDHDWAGMPWTSFSHFANQPGALAILPLYPLSSDTQGNSLDAIEQLNGELLRLTTLRLGKNSPHRTLPPLRFLPRTGPGSLFAPDYATCHQMTMSLCADIAASGVRKLVLFCPHSASRPFAATIAIDARAATGLSVYVLGVGSMTSLEEQQAYLVRESEILAGLFIEIMAHRVPDQSPVPEPAPLPLLCSAPSPLPYQGRTLASLDGVTLRKCALAPGATAIIPTAAIEQHGHHLPVGVDAILGQALLASMFEHLPSDRPIWVAPAVTYGKSNEHQGWAGTISIDAPTLHSLVTTIISELRGLGFRRIRILNTHGGNTAVLQSLIASLAGDDLDLDFLVSEFQPTLSPQEQAWGMHADEWETSLMLACAPNLVQMDKALCEYPARIDSPGILRPEKAQATFAWLTSDVSKSGVMGDPRQASLDKGKSWLASEGHALALRLLG